LQQQNKSLSESLDLNYHSKKERRSDEFDELSKLKLKQPIKLERNFFKTFNFSSCCLC